VAKRYYLFFASGPINFLMGKLLDVNAEDSHFSIFCIVTDVKQ
jgi:hypothetical protein